MSVFSYSMLLRGGKKDPPVFVAAANQSASGTSVSVTAPTSQAGDYIVAILAIESNNSEPAASTDFSLVASLFGSGQPQQYGLYTRVATSSEPASYMFNVSLSALKRCMVLVYRGANSIGNVSTKVRPASSTIPIPSIDLAGSGALVAVLAAGNEALVAFAPSGMTERTGGTDATPTAYAYDAIPTISGASGITTGTISGTTQTSGFQFEVLP